MHIWRKIAKYAVVTLFWVGLWWIASLLVGKEVLLPSPLVTAQKLLSLAGGSSFWISCGWSLLRILAGLFIGVAAGVVLAVLTAFFPPSRTFIAPLLTVIRSTPVASFIVLALIWIGRGMVPSFAASLMVVPVIWNSVSTAIDSADHSLLEMMQVFLFTPLKKLRAFYLPIILPSFAAGFQTSLGLAWKAGVAAEVLCTPRSAIGTSLYASKVYLKSADLFAWTITVILLSLLLENVFAALCSKWMRKRRWSDA